MSLRGSNALVTGGGSGIGLGCARRLLRDGATVTIVGRTEERLQRAAANLAADAPDGPQVRTAVCDVTDEESVAEAVRVADAGDGLRVVVASAGIPFLGPVAQMPLDGWRSLIDINLTGVFVTLKHAVPVFRQHGGGAFTAISSVGAVVPTSYVSAYSAAKAGVDMLVRCAADELGPWGIRVNAVRPGVVATEMTVMAERDEDLVRSIERNIVLGRVGLPEDVAAAVSYLSGPEATWVTGTFLTVDGGNQLRGHNDFSSVARAFYGPDWVPSASG